MSLLEVIHFRILFDGIGWEDEMDGEELFGARKGKMPVGEAWLLAEMVLNSIPQNLRYACVSQRAKIER